MLKDNSMRNSILAFGSLPEPQFYLDRKGQVKQMAFIYAVFNALGA